MCVKALKTIIICINNKDKVGQGKFSKFKSINILYKNLELNTLLIY